MCKRHAVNVYAILTLFCYPVPKQFQEQEKKRYLQEQQRFDTKHVKQLEEHRATADGTVR